MKRFLFTWGPAAFLAFAIYLYTAIPKNIILPNVWDKLVHLLVFVVLGFFTTRGLLLSKNLGRGTGLLLGAAMAGIWGVFDEFHQNFVPGRMPSWGDGLADVIGAFLGAVAFTYLGQALYRSETLYPKKQCEG